MLGITNTKVFYEFIYNMDKYATIQLFVNFLKYND